MSLEQAIRNVRIGYFADGPWSHRALEKLMADRSLQVAFICARCDNPDPVLREAGGRHGIPFLVHPNINSTEFAEVLSAFNCDLFVSMSFNQIFRKHVINSVPDGTINCHAGRLPFYRGRNILNWVLINDEKEFGITVHYVDEGVDTGDIIHQKTYPITDDDDYRTLLSRAYAGCADILYSSIKKIQENSVERIEQRSIHPVGFYCSSRREGDEKLDWNWGSREIFNFVRAICRPGPEARTFCNGHELRINRVELIGNAPIYKGIPGAVLEKSGSAFLVKTGDSFVRVIDCTGEVAVKVGDRLK